MSATNPVSGQKAAGDPMDKEVEAGYAALGQAETYDRDLLELVRAGRAALEALRNVPEVGGVYDQQHADTQLRADQALQQALEQFEPWLDNDEDPRSMGWVDDKGRP